MTWSWPRLRALDMKLVRDLVRLRPQAFAIAMVLAAGVATLILAVGAHRSLNETRSAYYERHRFADIFATVTRAPNFVALRAVEIPGVAAAEARIVKHALLDIEGMSEPATGVAISLPDQAPAAAQSHSPAAGPAAGAGPDQRGHRERGLCRGERLHHRLDASRRSSTAASAS